MASEPADISALLIAMKMRGNYGLARRKWLQTLAQIRQLPEKCSQPR